MIVSVFNSNRLGEIVNNSELKYSCNETNNESKRFKIKTMKNCLLTNIQPENNYKSNSSIYSC